MDPGVEGRGFRFLCNNFAFNSRRGKKPFNIRDTIRCITWWISGVKRNQSLKNFSRFWIYGSSVFSSDIIFPMYIFPLILRLHSESKSLTKRKTFRFGSIVMIP